MALSIKPNSTVLFTGDSITDCGRRGPNAPLGSGYAKMVVDLIRAMQPDCNCTFINTGISGNTVRDLYNRWSDDVIRYQPDHLSILIGINDLHRFKAKNPETSVSVEEYRDLYDKILARAVSETKAELTLMDPFYMSTDKSAGTHRTEVLALLPGYIAVVHDMVKKYKTRHVRTHEMFQTQLKYLPGDELGNEPVHPQPTGHLMMAHAWLEANRV